MSTVIWNLECLFSNALVKDELMIFPMGLFLFGLVLFVLGKRLKNGIISTVFKIKFN